MRNYNDREFIVVGEKLVNAVLHALEILLEL